MNTLPNTEIVLHILLAVGLILLTAKYLGVLARKIGIPEVAGMIVAGLLLRFLPWFKNFGGNEPNLIFAETNQFITYMAEIGVILIMFSAGLSTNLKSLIKSGPKATVIACCGVFVPLLMGTIMSFFFFGFTGWGTPEFFKCMFIGTILTATSVSITVAVLKEYGKLKTDIGQTIVSAAIIDDVIGIKKIIKIYYNYWNYSFNNSTWRKFRKRRLPYNHLKNISSLCMCNCSRLCSLQTFPLV